MPFPSGASRFTFPGAMIPDFDLQSAVNIGIAALVGLAVGIEREWTGHASGRPPQYAGVRTFFVLGLLAGIAGWFQAGGRGALAVVLLAGATVLTLLGYVMSARAERNEGVHGTTEAAGLLVLALAAAAGMGYRQLAAGATAVTLLALYEKSRIHAAVQKLGQHELLAALQFAVLALVILPLLPVGPYGPLGGLRPRTLWTVVLLFSALNFAGYVARRAVGEAAGYGVTGLLGGLVSSTVVTLNLSPISRKEPELSRPLALGVLAACTVFIPRVLLIAFLLNPGVALALIRYVAAPFAVGAALVAVPFVREMRQRKPSGRQPEPRNPLGLGSAIRMTLMFQLVLMVVWVVEQEFGARGVLWSAGIVGLTDLDALTLAMARLGQQAEMVTTAAKAIGIGVLANTLFKLGVALGLGGAAYRKLVTLGLGTLAVATGVALWIW
ncbi:MAG TPA: MgtC/SapB family protein [Gemmatimonadales bacterium]|nr:MgtC/SapB family protein [Gemmatimonadales bacterium]